MPDKHPHICQLQISPECPKQGFRDVAMLQYPDGHWAIPREKEIMLVNMGSNSSLASAVYTCRACMNLRGTTQKALNARLKTIKQEGSAPFANEPKPSAKVMAALRVELGIEEDEEE